jgi:hypothetical protein
MIANKVKLRAVMNNLLVRLSAILYMLTTFLQQIKQPNGLRYLRWGGDGEAAQLEKC